MASGAAVTYLLHRDDIPSAVIGIGLVLKRRRVLFVECFIVHVTNVLKMALKCLIWFEISHMYVKMFSFCGVLQNSYWGLKLTNVIRFFFWIFA